MDIKTDYLLALNFKNSLILFMISKLLYSHREELDAEGVECQ